MIPQQKQFMQHKRQDYQSEIFLHCLDSTCSKIKLIIVNVLFNEDETIGRIRIRSLATCESALKAFPLSSDVCRLYSVVSYKCNESLSTSAHVAVNLTLG